MSHHRIGYFRHRFASLLSDFLLSEPYVKLPQNLNHFYYYYKKKFCAPEYCKNTFHHEIVFIFFQSAPSWRRWRLFRISLFGTRQWVLQVNDALAVDITSKCIKIFFVMNLISLIVFLFLDWATLSLEQLMC